MDHNLQFFEKVSESITSLSPDVLVNITKLSSDLILPIKSILNLYNGIISIKDAILIQKLKLFLFELNKTNIEERTKLVQKIDNDLNYKTKVGEKIILILDQADDNEKASIIGKLFSCIVEGKINYDEFIICVGYVNRCSSSTMRDFLADRNFKFSLIAFDELISSGIYSTYYEDGNNNGVTNGIFHHVGIVGKKLWSCINNEKY